MAYKDRNAILTEIYKLMAEGKAVAEISRMDGMPSTSTIFLWLIEENKSDEYARAKEARADHMADEIVVIADNVTMPAEDRRIAIDARKWRVGKLHGKYSDKVKHVGGDDGDNPIAFTGFDIQFV
jgi:hypothetical protein